MNTYYHVSFEKVEKFVPKIPLVRLPEEDSSVKRICVCKTVRECFEAMPDGGISLLGLQRLALLHERMPTFYVYSVDEEDIKEHLLTEMDVFRLYGVQDALITGECWITESVPFKEELVILNHCELGELMITESGTEYMEVFDVTYETAGRDIVPMDYVIREVKGIKKHDIRQIYRLFAREEIDG